MDKKLRRGIFVALVALVVAIPVAMRRASPAPLQRWSDPATWGGRIPRAGENVLVPRGKRIVLDVAPPPLGRLDVEGELTVADRGLSLRAETVLVSGRLSIGSKAHRLLRPFRLDLDASRIATNPDAGMMFVIGRLDVYGRELAKTWTRLNATASAGSSILRLAETLPVQAGDRIVLASTGFDPDQCETVAVKAVKGDQIELREPLRYGHFGRVVSDVDERAEAGLLSRNVVFRGRGPEGIGGHVVIAAMGTAQIDGAEFVGMGQAGKLARYPIHFHMAGDQSASFVCNASVHDSFNRALTIHGTQNLRVDGLVAYRSYGHLVFLEDGVETGNRLTNNLAMRALAPPEARRLLTSDASPACFWVTNPANDLVGNVAAGSDGEGFWLAFPKGATGHSAARAEYAKIAPRKGKLGLFDLNRAHSNAANGLFVDGQPNPAGVYEAPSYVPKERATFDRFVAYKNHKRGVWMRGARLDVRRAVLADNPIGITLAASDSYLRESLVVGETENGRGGHKPGSPRFPIRGFEFYDGLVGVSDVTFRNFLPNDVREAGALSALRFSPFFINPNNFVERVHFVDAKPVFFDHVPSVGTGARSADGYRTLCFKDRDGSLTGIADATVSIANPFLAVKDRTNPKPDWNAYVTRQRFGRLFIDIPKGDPTSRLSCVIRHVDREGAAHRMGGNPFEGGATSFQTMIQPGGRYRVSFDGTTPPHLRLALRYFAKGERLHLDLPAPKGAFTVRLNRRRLLAHGVAVDGSRFRKEKGRIELEIAASSGPDTVVEILPSV